MEVGGGAPILVQSMTKTDTRDVEATLGQLKRLELAGCEVVRVAVPDEDALEGFAACLRESKVPVVADIHFSHSLAVRCIELGAHCVRINPGNIGGKQRLLEVVRAASDAGCAIRIGVNSGSLEKRLWAKYGGPKAEALAESALYWSAFLEDAGFFNFKVSIKSSDVVENYRSHLIFAQKSEAPLHVGITEAGFGEYGVVKSSVGIGSLLLNGIGDTIRVSLTGDPVREVEVGFAILKCLGLREAGPEIISCPTCGRRKIDVEALAQRVYEATKSLKRGIKIAVMGCEVNGPGEAREAHCGIAGGRTHSLIFKRGVVIKKVPNHEAVEALLEVIKDLEVDDAHQKASFPDKV